MVALGYAGLLTSLNVLFARLDLAMSGVVAPLLVAFIVVLVVNRVYARTQALLDRLFFRARYDSGQALARLADAMTTTLELDRLAALIGGTVDGILHPERVTLLLADDERGAFRRVGGGDGLAAQAALATCLAGRGGPVEVRAAHRAAADRAGAGRAGARQAGDRRLRALRRHRRLHAAGRPPGRGHGGSARGALLRRLPRRNSEKWRRRQRDGGRRAHGDLPGRRSPAPRPLRGDHRAGPPGARARDQRGRAAGRADRAARRRELGPGGGRRDQELGHGRHAPDLHRSEERRVGKECRSRWSP